MAHLVERSRRGRTEFWIKWRDPFSESWKWVSCRKAKATNKDLREELLEEYQDLEDKRQAEVERLGAAPRYETPVADLVDAYLEEAAERVKARADRNDRTGLAPATLQSYQEVLIPFRTFIRKRTTGEIDGEIIRRFRHRLATSGISAQTVNRHMRSLRAFLYRWSDANPPYYRIPAQALFGKALAAGNTGRTLPQVLPATSIRSWLEACRKRDRQRRPGKKVPVYPVAIMLALTGARTHELLGLRWGDVDLEAGSLVFRSQKTGRERLLPLVGDPTGDVSPGLLRLLERWRVKDSERHVLPSPYSEAPHFPRTAWDATRTETGMPEVKAKAFRSTWTSYLVSMGRPPAVVAWWAGHSPLVLERHYADFVRGRMDGANLDEVMGLADLLE